MPPWRKAFESCDHLHLLPSVCRDNSAGGSDPITSIFGASVHHRYHDNTEGSVSQTELASAVVLVCSTNGLTVIHTTFFCPCSGSIHSFISLTCRSLFEPSTVQLLWAQQSMFFFPSLQVTNLSNSWVSCFYWRCSAGVLVPLVLPSIIPPNWCDQFL